MPRNEHENVLQRRCGTAAHTVDGGEISIDLVALAAQPIVNDWFTGFTNLIDRSKIQFRVVEDFCALD